MTARRPLADRFWEKVQKTDSCWIFTGAGCGVGYGEIWAHGRVMRAHRVAYELLIGPVPEGLTLDHRCRNRRCVNPAHLEPVTNRENLLRGNGWSGRNARATHCPKGHPYSEENTTRRGGKRYCRTCARDLSRLTGRAKRGIVRALTIARLLDARDAAAVA